MERIRWQSILEQVSNVSTTALIHIFTFAEKSWEQFKLDSSLEYYKPFLKMNTKNVFINMCEVMTLDFDFY